MKKSYMCIGGRGASACYWSGDNPNKQGFATYCPVCGSYAVQTIKQTNEKEKPMSQNFQQYNSHDEAACFNCGSTLIAEQEPSGYAFGAYRKYCEKCKMFTFYDLKNEVNKK